MENVLIELTLCHENGVSWNGTPDSETNDKITINPSYYEFVKPQKEDKYGMRYRPAGTYSTFCYAKEPYSKIISELERAGIIILRVKE